MQRAEKHLAARALAEDLKSREAVFSFDFRGLTVAEVTDLRRRVRGAGGVCRVVKNSTARWAFRDAGIEGLDEHLTGMTGLAWSNEDVVGLAKALHESMEEFEALTYKGGVVSNRTVGTEDFEALARLPGREALEARLVGTIAAPLRNLLTVLQGVPRNLILVLRAVQQKTEADA